MRFVLNCNVSPKVREELQALGHQAKLANPVLPDLQILRDAVAEGAIVVSLDQDYGELVYRHGEPHAGIVLVTLRRATAESQIRILRNALSRGLIAEGKFLRLNDADLHLGIDAPDPSKLGI